jgi:hypothetical protein
MPEGDRAFDQKFQVAVDAVERRWRLLGEPATRLTAQQMSPYRGIDPALGWRVSVELTGGPRRFDILATRNFPYSAPRIALVDRPDFLDWAHVEKNGLLCLLPEHSTLSIDRPADVVEDLLVMALDLVESLLQGGRQDELRSEFLSYWGNTTTLRNATILSLLRPCGPARLVRVWQGRSRIIAAETDEELRSWLTNMDPKLTKRSLRFEDGVFTWFEEALLPSEYPGSAAEVRALAHRADAADLLDKVSQNIPDRLFMFIGAMTEHGPAEAAIVVERPKVISNRDPLTKGFRPKSVPEPVFRMRFFGGLPAMKASVERVDPSWIHGRGQDPRFATLAKSTALIFGCGSVGAPVAMMCAHAGFGRIVLVDNQKMKSANVGRHPLGVSSIDKHKVTALAARLRAELPHIVVEAHVADAQNLLRLDDPLIRSADVIVSAMGSWPADAMLDEWHQAMGRKIPVVYGWTEAHAAAGHAVAIVSRGARLRDGLDETGVSKFTATQWTEDQRKQEPACGAAFEPYGPVELGYVTTMVAETVMDCILDPPGRSEHRIWLGRRSTLERAGGQWTAAIQQVAGGKPDGGTTIRRAWALDPSAKVLAA